MSGLVLIFRCLRRCQEIFHIYAVNLHCIHMDPWHVWMKCNMSVLEVLDKSLQSLNYIVNSDVFCPLAMSGRSSNVIGRASCMATITARLVTSKSWWKDKTRHTFAPPLQQCHYHRFLPALTIFMTRYYNGIHCTLHLMRIRVPHCVLIDAYTLPTLLECHTASMHTSYTHNNGDATSNFLVIISIIVNMPYTCIDLVRSYSHTC